MPRSPIRLDDDVWAECQRLGQVYGTINEGLRASLIGDKYTPEIERKIKTNVTPRVFKGALLKSKDRK